jgi:quinol monooxygenase YgiN
VAVAVRVHPRASALPPSPNGRIVQMADGVVVGTTPADPGVGPDRAFCALSGTTEGSMSVKVVLEFQTTPDNVQSVKDLFRSVLPDTRAYDGFESLTVHQNEEDPTAFLVWEQWATRPHYEKYLAWRTETGDLDKLLGMLVGQPSFRFFNHVGV